MNYELAKKLKDAGFPQKERSIIVGNEDSFTPDPARLDVYYVPTLSELIEACGDDIFLEMCRVGHNDWLATDGEHNMRGSTPEIAVANLWLELNKKQ